MGAPRWRLLATDYDRTVTRHPFGLHPAVPEAIQRAQAAGVKVAVVSGQPMARLKQALPGLDAYAAENGAVVWVEGAKEPWVHAWPERAALVATLQRADLPHTSFDVIFDLDRAHESMLHALLKPAHRARVFANVDRLNVGPADASKGRGLAEIQRFLGVPQEATVAIGDGENDPPMFAAAGLALAVANATDAAKQAAHRVLALPDGEGVAAVISELLAGRLAPPAPGPPAPTPSHVGG